MKSISSGSSDKTTLSAPDDPTMATPPPADGDDDVSHTAKEDAGMDQMSGEKGRRKQSYANHISHSAIDYDCLDSHVGHTLSQFLCNSLAILRALHIFCDFAPLSLVLQEWAAPRARSHIASNLQTRRAKPTLLGWPLVSLLNVNLQCAAQMRNLVRRSRGTRGG